MNKFLGNAIVWLAKKKDSIDIGSHFKFSNSKYEKDVKVFSPSQLSSNKDLDVFVVDAEDENLNDSDVDAIVEFVKNGGGLLIGGQAWFYGDRPLMTYPGNR